jgi:signal transduction histidine kinase
VPVELSQLLTVLAHELRGPVGVLQGYIRLLGRNGSGREADPGVLEAMLAATGRLTAIGQDASSLARWLQAAADDRAHDVPRPVHDMLTALSALLPASATLEPAPDAVGRAAVPTRDLGLLARALAEVCKAVARAHDSATICRVRADETAVVMTIDPVPGAEPAPERAAGSGSPPTDSPHRPLTFSMGGLGLGLVLASYVLDGHRADVTTLGSGTVDVRLPRAEVAS